MVLSLKTVSAYAYNTQAMMHDKAIRQPASVYSSTRAKNHHPKSIIEPQTTISSPAHPLLASFTHIIDRRVEHNTAPKPLPSQVIIALERFQRISVQHLHA